jgi:hypothetical protein
LIDPSSRILSSSKTNMRGGLVRVFYIPSPYRNV